MVEEMITIKVWLDSGANIHSCYRSEFTIEKEAWDSMNEDEKRDYAKEVAWERADWGFQE